MKSGNMATAPKNYRAEDAITCSVCAHGYRASEHPSCNGCPLNRGCAMNCCPNCGASNIDPSQSALVGWVKKIISGGTRVSA